MARRPKVWVPRRWTHMENHEYSFICIGSLMVKFDKIYPMRKDETESASNNEGGVLNESKNGTIALDKAYLR